MVKAARLPIAGKIRFIPKWLDTNPTTYQRAQREVSLIGLGIMDKEASCWSRTGGNTLGSSAVTKRIISVEPLIKKG